MDAAPAAEILMNDLLDTFLLFLFIVVLPWSFVLYCGKGLARYGYSCKMIWKKRIMVNNKRIDFAACNRET